MISSKTTSGQLFKALEALNLKYDNNIVFKRFPEDINRAGTRQRFTITVRDSKETGSRRSADGRRIAAACWHVHGHLFDEILKVNPAAVIQTGLQGARKIYIDDNGTTCGNWEDSNIGSQMQPCMASEACEC